MTTDELLSKLDAVIGKRAEIPEQVRLKLETSLVNTINQLYGLKANEPSAEEIKNVMDYLK